MKKSRKKVVLTCNECGLEIKGGSHMSRHVRLIHNYKTYDEYKLKHNLIKSVEDLKKEGALSCGICGLFSHDLTSHVLRIHKMKVLDYKKNYGNVKSERCISEMSKRFSGENNPGYNHGGKYSPFSNDFIHANSTDRDELINRVKETKRKNNSNTTSLEYWLKRGLNEEDARKNLKERQQTFTLEKCILKYGKEKGTEIWLNRQEKWQNSLRKSFAGGFSKISQNLFWKIFEKIENKTTVYFAQLDDNKLPDYSGKNYEYGIKLKTRMILPDFYDESSRKIIEFDGTYWHSEKVKKSPNRISDVERDALLIKEGYKILRIKEEDYKSNPEKTVNQCLIFLNG